MDETKQITYEISFDKSEEKFGSDHPNVCHFVLADGSVKAIGVDIKLRVLELLSTIKNQE